MLYVEAYDGLAGILLPRAHPCAGVLVGPSGGTDWGSWLGVVDGWSCLTADVGVFVFAVGEIVAVLSSRVCRSSDCLIEVIAGSSTYGRVSIFGVLEVFFLFRAALSDSCFLLVSMLVSVLSGSLF